MLKKKKIVNKKNTIVTCEAKIVEILSEDMYKVKLKNSNDLIIGYMSSIMLKNNVKLLKDELVIVEYDYSNSNKCRIVFKK